MMAVLELVELNFTTFFPPYKSNSCVDPTADKTY